MLITHETDRLILKTINNEAASLVLSFYENNKLQFEPWEPKRSDNFYTLSYQKASLTAEYNQMSEGKLLRYWIFLKNYPEEIIGSVCFQNFLGQPYHSCSLGYKFSHKHLHQGYAQEGISKGIKLMFDERKLHRMEAFILPNNGPSIKLIERLSFRYEGISYSFARIDGNWTDHKRFSLINPFDIKSQEEAITISL